ncbi:hypothetical protein E4U52_006647 [Claviceps spartinae]|nr:hypothetical protein E4U52_006647 [Claviceps spartinae]
MSTYALFLVRFGEVLPSHHGIFIQTNEDGVGTLLDVRGAVSATGRLVFRCNDERLSRFKVAEAKGFVSRAQIAELQRICGAVPTPESQYLCTSEVGYAVPACRCGEWTTSAWRAVDGSGIVAEGLGM